MLLDDEVEDLGTEEEEDGRSDWCSLLSLLFPFLSLPRIPVTLALVPQKTRLSSRPCYSSDPERM